MSYILSIDTGYANTFAREINSYKNELQDVINSCNSAKKKTISYSDGEINSANTYLENLIKHLENKKTVADSLKKSTDNYVSEVCDIETIIKNKIKHSSEQLYKEKHIGSFGGNIFIRAWNSLTTSVDKCLDFLNSNEAYKYHRAIVKDTAKILGDGIMICAVITACGLTGPLGLAILAGATWMITKDLYKLHNDWEALRAHGDNDKETAESYANRTLTKDLLNWTNNNTFVKGIVIGLDLCEFTVIFCSMFIAFGKTFNINELHQYDIANKSSRSFKQSVTYFKNTNWLRSDRFGSMENWKNFFQNMVFGDSFIENAIKKGNADYTDFKMLKPFINLISSVTQTAIA